MLEEKPWLEIEREGVRKTEGKTSFLCRERVTGDNLLTDRSTAKYCLDVTTGQRGNNT